MQGMIMHHAQAIEMTALIEARTENKNLRLLGARISQSQSDEMKFMKRWLEIRGESISMPMADMSNMDMADMDMSSHDHQLMPGMLSPEQMAQLDRARGVEFDRLFLTFMIQHHQGVLTLVDQLFGSQGAGQDEPVFRFASDVYADQSTEIERMQRMLAALPPGGRSP